MTEKEQLIRTAGLIGVAMDEICWSLPEGMPIPPRMRRHLEALGRVFDDCCNILIRDWGMSTDDLAALVHCPDFD